MGWHTLAPPAEAQLLEFGEATDRSTEELGRLFGDGGAMVATPALVDPALPIGAEGAGCGKGVVAAALCLTHFIDDRAECCASPALSQRYQAPDWDTGS
eukprot:SAG11_NODE_9209_length_933_cov_0.858513_2_plen_99_part_00